MQRDEWLRTKSTEMASARRAGRLYGVLDETLIGSEDAAYELQGAAIAAYGKPVAGWKIGATTKEIQARIGASQPFSGPIFSNDIFGDGAELPVAPGMRGVESEIAFRLAADLPRRDVGYSVEEIAGSVSEAALAIEVIAKWQAFEGRPNVFQSIADFGLNGALVIGPRLEGWRDIDLSHIEARCLVNGAEKAAGRADVVMGNPINALVWLAQEGPGIKAGQWISSGTMTGLTPVAAGDEVVAEFAGLGRVQVRFEKG